MEKNLLGLGMEYGPGQLDQWMRRCWLGGTHKEEGWGAS